MEHRKSPVDLSFDLTDSSIHNHAVAILLSKDNGEIILTQGLFAYLVEGGDSLYYKRVNADDWILIANWCMYDAYMVVRYRKAKWLRPMYESLFSRMNFKSVVFDDYSIELRGTDGEILRSRRFRLSPPGAFEKVMTEKLGCSEDKLEVLKSLAFD